MKIKLNGSRHSILIRYLLSFLLTLAIPLSVVFIYSFQDLNSRLERQSIEEQQAELIRIAGRMDGYFANIQMSSHRFHSSPDILRYKLQNLQEFGFDIINELKSSCGQNVLLNNIYIFSPENRYAYSSTSSYTRENFTAYITGSSKTPEEYAAFAWEAAQRRRPVYTEHQVYLYYPFEQGGKNAVLIYELGLAQLREQLQQELTGPEEYLGVYSEQGRLLISAGDPLFAEAAGEAAFSPPSEGESLPEAVLFRDGSPKTMLRKSPYVDWRYVYCRGASRETELVRQSHARLFFFFSLILAAGSMLVFLLSYLSYRPIRELKTAARKLLPEGPVRDRTARNELEVVRSVLSSLHHSVEELSELKDVNRRALKQYVVMHTALGLVRDYAVVRTYLDQLGVLEKRPYYFAVLLYLSEQSALSGLNGQEDMESYAGFLESYPAEQIDVCAVHGSSFNQMVLLVSADGDDIQRYFPLLQEMRRAFSEKFRSRAVLSVGMAYPKLDFISLSYMQALTAYEYRTIGDCDCVIAFDPLAAGLGTDIRHQNFLGYLQQAMDSASAEDVATTFQYILQWIDTEDITVHNAKFLCFGILKIISASLYGYKYDYFSRFSEQYDLSMVMGVETLHELRRFLLYLSEATCRYVSEYGAVCREKEQEETQSAQQISLGGLAGFIEDNLSDSRLSAAFLAERFGYSVSYFSKLFKDMFHVTIYEYVNEHRMRRAEELLLSTEDTLDSIVASIGYLDTSSFIRKFKKRAGVTPGDYRRLHGQTGGAPDPLPRSG